MMCFSISTRAPSNRKRAGILDRLVGFMNESKSTKVALSGYTDNIGTEAYNLKLSDRRWMSAQGLHRQEGHRQRPRLRPGLRRK